MAIITMEIQFDCLFTEEYTDEDKKSFILNGWIEFSPEYFNACKKFNVKKKKEIEKVISKINDKYGTQCDDYDLSDTIIESFFDVYYDYTENPDNSEKKLEDILAFLSELKGKYPYAHLGWYVSQQTFDNNND